MTPFVARRPVSGNFLIAAKLKVAFASTAAAWAMVVIATPLALRFSGAMPVVGELIDRFIEIFGAARSLFVLLLGVLALIAATWKQLVQSLCIGMTGRPWLVKGSVFATLSAITILDLTAGWTITDSHRFAVAWNAIPEVVAVAAAVKVIAALVVIRRLRARRLFSDRELLAAVFYWDAAVFALFALLEWSVPGLLVRGALLLSFSILAVPLVRLAAAPLAVSRNRCA
jgi:hypothetical protein